MVVVDARGQTLGRLRSQVARILMGKENPLYTPFLDTGDHVIVINAEKFRTTGMKAEQKSYQHLTPDIRGGLRTEEFKKRCPQAGSDHRSRRWSACCPRPSWAAQMFTKLNVYRATSIRIKRRSQDLALA